jgi:GxxExxY protein
MGDMGANSASSATPELDKITEEIIGAAFAVSNALGIGFLEKVYENAMVIELHIVTSPLHNRATTRFGTEERL